MDGNAPPANAAAATAPRRIGPYELEASLGTGPHGTVHRARHAASGALVALKLLAPAPLEPRLRARLEREVRAQATLEHAGIARFLEAGQDGATTWVASPLAPGTSLRARIDQAAVPARDALALVARLASIVAQAHEAGVVHAGLKPENVLLDGSEPRVTDWGLVRALGLDSPDATAALGLAPEQARGRTNLVDARTDVWALGAILAEALAGEPPFAADDVATLLTAIQEKEPRPLPARDALEQAAATIARRCLEKDREDRYPEAQELAEDCRRALQGAPLLARPPGLVERVRRSAARRPGRLVGLLVGMGAAALSLFAVALIEQEERKDAERALRSLESDRETGRAAAREAEARATRDRRELEGRALRTELESAALARLSPEDVRARAQALAALDPSPATLVLAADALASVELADDAAALLERAARTPDAAPAALLALASLREHDDRDATAILRRAVESASGPLAEDPGALAARAALETDPARALDLLGKAIERDRRSARLHVRRALVRERLGEVEPALADLEAAEELAPRLAEPCLERSRILRLRGEAALALGEAERALALAPRWPRALLERARVRRALGLPREARADLERALGLRPELVAAFVLRGEVKADAGDGPGALGDLDRALELSPNDGPARVARASFRLAHEDAAGALADAEAAVVAAPELPAAWIVRGRTRGRLGDRAAGARDLRKAIELLGTRATRELRDEASALEK